MSSNSNAVKDKHLGMSHGKAQGILRKNIMFSLMQKCKEDECFKCGEIIEFVDDLSIEHKTPWLYGDISLFWDLDNIAFSHIKCNRPDRPYTTNTHNSARYQDGCRCKECKNAHALRLSRYRENLKSRGIKRKN